MTPDKSEYLRFFVAEVEDSGIVSQDYYNKVDDTVDGRNPAPPGMSRPCK